MQQTIRKEKPWYKWVVVVACFLMIFVCLGFGSSNKSMYLGAITKALGIKRSLFSLNDSFRFISTAIMNLFFGTLIAKFGPRKLIAAGFLCLTISTFIYSVASDVLLFYVGGCFLGMGMSFTSTTMVSYLINRWAPEHRGTLSGAVLCANGVGGALAAQIISPLINDPADPFGYRNAYRMVVILLVVVGVIVTCLIREPAGAGPGTVAKKKPRGKQWSGIAFKDALRRPYFYAAAVCVLLTGTSLQGINGISAAHMGDVGLDAGYVATVLSTHSLALACAKFLAGFSYDKLGLRATVTICDIFGFAAFSCLAFASTSMVGQGLAMGYGVMSSLAMPLETVIVPLIAADLFGEKDFAKTMGIFVSLNTAGYALGTPVANLIFDIVGSYKPILLIFGILMLVLAVAFQFILNAANKEKQRILAQEAPNN